MCPGFVSLVQTRVVLLAITSSNATRLEDRKRGHLLIGFLLSGEYPVPGPEQSFLLDPESHEQS